MNHEGIMRKSFYVNISLVIIKIVSGVLFTSTALIADGIHSISDLMSDIFVILGIRHSIKPADEDHPFGHGKFEYVLSLFLGLSIIGIAVNLGREVIQMWNDVPQVPGLLSLVVIILVVGIKLILSSYLIRKGNETGSEIIEASGKESFSDVISSGVVFFGILVAILGDRFSVSWLLYGDKVASIIVAAFIIRIGILIVLQAIQSLQGKSVKQEICNEYKAMIEEVDGVLNVDQLEMVAYGPYYQAIVDIRVKGTMTVKAGHDIAHDVEERLLANERLCHVSVHVNPGGENK